MVIGRKMDRQRVEAALRSCVLTDIELAAWPPETWETTFGDPWGWNQLIAKQAAENGDLGDLGHGHAHSHDHSHSHACDDDCVDDCEYVGSM